MVESAGFCREFCLYFGCFRPSRKANYRTTGFVCLWQDFLWTSILHAMNTSHLNTWGSSTPLAGGQNGSTDMKMKCSVFRGLLNCSRLVQSFSSCLLSVICRGFSFPLMVILKLQTCTDYAILPIPFAIPFPRPKHHFLHGCTIQQAKAAWAPWRSFSRLQEIQEKNE